jgi:hypothetical protein
MTGAKTTKQARKRRTLSKRPSVATEQKIAAKPRQGRGSAKKEGGTIHGEKSAPRLDKRPRGKVMKRAEGGNVDDEHFSPLPSGRGRTAGQAALAGLVHGVSDVAGTPGDVKHMYDVGSQYALSKGAEKLGLISPEHGALLREDMRSGPYRDRGAPDPTPNQLSPLGSASINDHLLRAIAQLGITDGSDE